MTLADITERTWQEQVRELATILGWKVMHVRRSIGKGQRWTTATSIVGWPDLFLYHPGRGWHCAVELKSQSGKTTPEQDGVLDDLIASGVPAFVWRPSDLDAVRYVLQNGPT